MNISNVRRPGVSGSCCYPNNPEPLLPACLLKLPLGAIRPKGWLGHQIKLMARGMTGRLAELSEFVSLEKGWSGPENSIWEEVPYWLRGFYPMAVLSGNRSLFKEANAWIDQVLASQTGDGWFGPPEARNFRYRGGADECDLWPHMIMIDALIQHHEYTGDQRVIDLMMRFFRFCHSRRLPLTRYDSIVSAWKDAAVPQRVPVLQLIRGGDMIPHIHWLYRCTGEEWLLECAWDFYRAVLPPWRGEPPDRSEWLDSHVVNFVQRFAYPGLFYPQSGDDRLLSLTEYWRTQHIGTWGQQPRGIFGSDEHIRAGHVDPRQGFETCAMTEFAKNFYLLGRITGDTIHADRCEDLMLNHFPCSMTPDLKALHYLTASNQPQLDASTRHEYGNKGRQICYSPHIYRCCQHNVAMGWPWYAQNLWQATGDGGLVSWLYAASEVTANVGESGRQVTIVSETDYPFDETVRVRIEPGRPTAFPLYLRVPAWCSECAVRVNKTARELTVEPGSYVRIDRKWTGGDTVQLRMLTDLKLKEWPRTGSVTVDRGPLSYSLKIREKWRRVGGTDDWPEWEVLPASPWNYALAVNKKRPSASLKIRRKGGSRRQPWKPESAPLEIRGRGRRISGWGLENETVAELRQSPVKTGEPEENITLIPLGCARLRMACLPVVGQGRYDNEWNQHDHL